MYLLPPAVAVVANAAPLLHPDNIPGVPGPLQLAPLQHQLHSWGRSAYSRLVISNLKIKKLISHPFSMALFSNNFFLERKSENIQDKDTTRCEQKKGTAHLARSPNPNCFVKSSHNLLVDTPLFQHLERKPKNVWTILRSAANLAWFFLTTLQLLQT